MKKGIERICVNAGQAAYPSPHWPTPDGLVVLLHFPLPSPECGLGLGALLLGLDKALLLLCELEPKDLDV